MISLSRVKDRVLRFTVTRKHWDQALAISQFSGKPAKACRCPVALAANEAIRKKFRRCPQACVVIGPTSYAIFDDGPEMNPSPIRRGPLPESAKAMVAEYDLFNDFPGDIVVELAL